MWKIGFWSAAAFVLGLVLLPAFLDDDATPGVVPSPSGTGFTPGTAAVAPEWEWEDDESVIGGMSYYVDAIVFDISGETAKCCIRAGCRPVGCEAPACRHCLFR